MAARGPVCPDCNKQLEGGFLLDRADQGGVAKWVAGPPEKSFWTGIKFKDRRALDVYAWRCPSCSRVHLFAPETDR